ncbi:Hypothetical_protein [Hexamita inflata]|uniref:Hypothetical_protein n=1 Tax=Hexamita inflata TaxID=28002 RepID=A0AA86NPS5_9EUKA|nr:Hypothetical protein HINF_LOCUS11515 [Hexamita inflata]
MTFSLVSAALLCNTELVSLLRCFCWGSARWRPGCRFGCAFLVGEWRWASSGLAAWRERLRCGAAWSSGSQCGGFAAWGSLGRVLPWFCSLICLLFACFVLFRLPGICFSAAEFSLFYFPLGKWRQTLELRVPSSNPGRESHADPLWEHFAYNNPIKQGSSALDKSL